MGWFLNWKVETNNVHSKCDVHGQFVDGQFVQLILHPNNIYEYMNLVRPQPYDLFKISQVIITHAV